MAVLRSSLARPIKLVAPLYEGRNCRPDGPLPYASGLPFACAASAFAYALIRTPCPMDAVAALRCLGLDEFAFEFRKAAQDGHIRRPAVVVVSVRSPREIGPTLWSVMAFRKQQQINGGFCWGLLTTRVLPVFRKRLIWPVWPVRFCAGLVDSTVAFRRLPRFNASTVTAL